MTTEGLPLFEGLFKAHGDFISRFRGGVLLGNILMKLLCAVLISLRDSSLDSLFEERLLEQRGVVQDLIKAKFNLSFLLEYLQSLAHALFQRKASKDLDAKIVAAEEALTRAHKALQDLKVKKHLILSSLTVPAIPLEGSLLTGFISQPLSLDNSRCIRCFVCVCVCVSFSPFFFELSLGPWLLQLLVVGLKPGTLMVVFLRRY